MLKTVLSLLRVRPSDTKADAELTELGEEHLDHVSAAAAVKLGSPPILMVTPSGNVKLFLNHLF